MSDLAPQSAPNQSPALAGPALSLDEAATLTVKLLLALAAWYRTSGDFAMAGRLLAMLETRSQSQQLAQEQAYLALATGRPEEAIRRLTEIAAEKGTLSAWVALGRCLLELGDLDSAADIASTQVERNPDSITAHLLAGDLARARGDVPAATGHYQSILNLAPENASAQAGLCRLALLAGDRVAATGLLDRILAGETPLSITLVMTCAAQAELLDQPLRAASLRRRALLLEAERAANLAAEVDAALYRPGQTETSFNQDQAEMYPLFDFSNEPPASQEPAPVPTPDSAADPETVAPAMAPTEPAPVVATLSTAPAEIAVDPRVTEVLQREFGYEHLRSGQAAVIEKVMAGRDTLAIMPTGAGKSLTFQIPAMLRDGTTLVLSPLIALMKDQYDSLPPAIQARTALLNSSLSSEEQRRVVNGISGGAYKLIYAAPERLRQHTFIKALRAANTDLVVVDEAHCISLWGHDFRPDYLTIPSALRELNNPALLAITATATRRMANGIKEGFGRDLDEIRTSVFRPNLFYEAHVLANREQKVQHAVNISREERGAGIIYVRSRRDAESIAAILRDRGVGAVPYHAGLDQATRAANQERFMSGRARVVVATTAFGMGVNKSDVRFIVHLSPTPSLEAYAQESGRAGRDGLPARCVMLATKSDRSTLSRMARRDEQGIDTLRRVYAGLKQAATGRWALLDPDSLLRWQPLDPDADEEPDPRIALGLLVQANLIRRHADLPASYTMKRSPAPDPEPAEPDPLWEALLAWLGVGLTSSPVTFRTGEALRALDCTPDDLVRTLTARPDLELRDGPRLACFELLPAGPDAGPRIERVLAQVRQEADARIQQVMSYVHATRCRHALLARHLGEALADCGDRCDVCAPSSTTVETAGGADERTYFTSEDALTTLEAIRSLSFALGKPGLTKFLLGSVESRVRADRSPYFGRLGGLKKGVVERLIDRMLDDGLIEHYLDREYRLLRLTDTGRRAQAEDLAGYDTGPARRRQPGSESTVAVNGEVDEALYERLREWRRDRAIRDAVPPYVVGSDQTLRALAEYRPHDDATLLTVPGIGPAKVEKYGSEILAVVAAAD